MDTVKLRLFLALALGLLTAAGLLVLLGVSGTGPPVVQADSVTSSRSPCSPQAEPEWHKMGSTVALILTAIEQGFTIHPETQLGRIQLDVETSGTVQVSVRFDDELTPDEVLALEDAFGLQFHRLDGALAHVANIYGLTLAPSRMAELSLEPSVTQIELLNKPVTVPLDISIPQIGADQVWATLDWTGQNIRGGGVRIADFDTGVDVYHPDFWRADGGTFSWRDDDGGGFTGGGGECVDLNRNNACEFVTETLRFFDEGGSAGIGTTGVFSADIDWLYNDVDTDTSRDFGASAGYTETQPTYGERIFLVDDSNLNNLLDVGENLVALHTSKVYATLNCGTSPVTRTRGVDLYQSDSDTNGHGTGVAGVALGGNVINVSGTYTVPNRRFVGVAPDAELLSAKMGCWPNPIPETTYIPWAANHGADVMLYEFGGWVFEFLDGSSNMEQMIDAQAANGVVQVVPAGNLAGSNKEDTRTVPANGSHVFTANVPGFPLIINGARQTFLWRNTGLYMTLTITTPTGLTATLSAATAGTGWSWIPLSDGHQIWYRRANSNRGTAKYDIWIQKSFSPIDLGNWLIRVDNPSGTAQTVYAYVTDNYYLWNGGISWVNANETKTVDWPATADSAVTVASYSTRQGFDSINAGDLSSFSSRGSWISPRRAAYSK